MGRLSFQIILLILTVSSSTVLAQQITEPSKAILGSSGATTIVDVTLGKEFTTVSGMPRAFLYSIDKKKNEVEVTSISNGITSPYRTFQILIPDGAYNADLSYEVLVFVPSVDEGGHPITLKKSIKVSGLFTVEITTEDNCKGGLMMTTRTQSQNGAVWDQVYNWLRQFADPNAGGLATVTVTVPNDPQQYPNHIKTTRWKKAVGRQFKVCMLFEDPLPNKDFTGEFAFNGPNLPPSMETASGEELSGRITVPFPVDKAIDAPADRAFERNLDLGVTFTSEVADKTIPKTTTTPEMIVRQRTSRGVIDLRFAPWMDVLHPALKTNTWQHHLTPLEINANVSTGKIDEDTLGLNRVLIGLEGESRYIRKKVFHEGLDDERTSYPIWHRVIWGFTHASDRGFKQKEFTGKIEYQPVFDKLYQPYALRNTADAKGYKHQNPLGFTVLPKVGFEIGRTYSRRNPAPAIKPSDTVRRFYFGGEIDFDITEYVTLSVADDLYFRGEIPNDHSKNYFKGSGEFRLGRSRNGLFAHSLFVVFERGQQPPFASPDVNSFRIGYRIQGNYCGDHCR